MKIEARNTHNKGISALFEISSLHGFNRLSTSSHRCAWILAITVATAIFAAMFSVQLSSFNNNPISTVIEVNYPTNLVQYPHIEICNKNFVYRPNTKKLEDIVVERGIAESGDVFYRVLRDILTDEKLEPENHRKIFKGLGLLGYRLRPLVLEVGITCEALLYNCTWKTIDIDCKKMFQRVVSLDTICCRFDMEYFKNNTKDLDIEYNPGRRSDTGLNVAINFTTQPNKKDEAKVYFFYDERTMFDNPYELDMDSSMVVAVKPEVMSSSAYVLEMSPSRRNCGLNNKNSLSAAVGLKARYTYEKCLTHYFHKAVFDECQCIPFYVKDIDPGGGWEDFDLCGGSKLICVTAMKKNYTINKNKYMEFKACLHSCDEVNYKLEVNILNEWKPVNRTLSVFFSDTNCYKFTKVALLTWDQAFASVGGIFGICLGGSIISMVECVYAAITLLYPKVVAFANQIYQRKNKIKPNAKHKLELLKQYLLSFKNINEKYQN